MTIKRPGFIAVLVAIFFTISPCIFAYNGGTHPFTEIDSKGNYILGGQFKTLVVSGSNSRALEISGPVTGGFLNDSVTAAICSNTNIYELTSKLVFQRRAESFKNLKCSTLEGQLAQYSEGKVWIGEGKRFDVDDVHALLHNFRDFFVIYRNGSISKLIPTGLIPLAGSIGPLSEKSTIRMANSAIMRADDTGVYRFEVRENRILEKLRVPVNPCSDNERCGLSLASDGSYVVSGYWGLWQGQGESVRRISGISNLSREGGNSSVAHNKLGGKYLYLGDDDVDMGQLSELDFTDLPINGSSIRAVWVKGYHNQESFSWTAINGQKGSIIFQNVSDPLPENWASYEAESMIETHLVSKASSLGYLDLHRSENINSNFWWRDQLQLDLILKRLKDGKSRQVLVGVIDTGIASDHPGLLNQISVNSGEVPGNSLDDDQNGLVDDYLGWDFVHDDETPEDEHGHGTHVSGLIAGRMPNGSSLGPASSVAKLVIAKGLGVGGRSNSLDLARAVAYAVNRKAEILNCSWGGGFATQVLRDAIEYALSEGVIVMMSAGNSSLDLDKSKEFPKMIPGLTLVASSDEKRAKSNSSNFGKFSVDWAVPGDRMLSTTKDGRYGEMSGTSMANALSSGITALALSVGDPSAGDPLPTNVLKRLCTTAIRQGWESRVECGLLDPISYFDFSNLNLTSKEK